MQSTYVGEFRGESEGLSNIGFRSRFPLGCITDLRFSCKRTTGWRVAAGEYRWLNAYHPPEAHKTDDFPTARTRRAAPSASQPTHVSHSEPGPDTRLQWARYVSFDMWKMSHVPSPSAIW